MKPLQSTLVFALSISCIAASVVLQVPPAAAQNCSMPPEELEPRTMVVELSPGHNETWERVLYSPFQGTPTTDNVNITGIIARGSGMRMLGIQLADDVRGGLDTDMYTATLMPLLPPNQEPQTDMGSDMYFVMPVEDEMNVFLLLTFNPTPSASFPACYTETLTLQEPDARPPGLVAVTHVDNPEAELDFITLDFDEPLGAFKLMSLSIGAVNDCEVFNARPLFTPGDQVVTLSITPGRFRQPADCDLATLASGNTVQVDAAATADLAGNRLPEDNDSATYPGTGEAWEVEGSEALMVEATESSDTEVEKYAAALGALIEGLQHKLQENTGWRAKLRHALTRRQPGANEPTAELVDLLQPLQKDFQRALR